MLGVRNPFRRKKPAVPCRGAARAARRRADRTLLKGDRAARAHALSEPFRRRIVWAIEELKAAKRKGWAPA